MTPAEVHKIIAGLRSRAAGVELRLFNAGYREAAAAVYDARLRLAEATRGLQETPAPGADLSRKDEGK